MELIDEEMNLQLLNAELSTRRMAMKRDTYSYTHPRDDPPSHSHGHRGLSIEHVYTKQIFVYEEEVDDENL
jgi:hypothetical protein